MPRSARNFAGGRMGKHDAKRVVLIEADETRLTIQPRETERGTAMSFRR